MASESVAHSAFGLMGYWLRAHSGSRNNCQIFILEPTFINKSMISFFFSYAVVKAMKKALKQEGQTSAVSDNGKKV